MDENQRKMKSEERERRGGLVAKYGKSLMTRRGREDARLFCSLLGC